MSELLEPKVERPSQRERILRLLNAGPVCGTSFLFLKMPRYSARIWELRKVGFNITTRRCTDPRHHSRQVEYILS